MIIEIRLKGPSCDTDNYLETSSTLVTDVASIKFPDHGFDWEKIVFYKV